MQSKFMTAMVALCVTKAQFANKEVSSLDHAYQREVALGQALAALAEEMGVTLRQPLHIDSRGEYFLVVADSTPEQPAQAYGSEFAALLTKHQPRCGVAPGAHLTAQASWCHMNHFDAERLVYEVFASKIEASVFCPGDYVTLVYAPTGCSSQASAVTVGNTYQVKYLDGSCLGVSSDKVTEYATIWRGSFILAEASAQALG